MSEIRQDILEFAKAMNEIVDAKQWQKGDTWVDCDIELMGEVLQYSCVPLSHWNRKELVDVANLYMMVYLRLGDSE